MSDVVSLDIAVYVQSTSKLVHLLRLWGSGKTPFISHERHNDERIEELRVVSRPRVREIGLDDYAGRQLRIRRPVSLREILLTRECRGGCRGRRKRFAQVVGLSSQR